MSYQPGPFDRDHIQLTWGGKLPGNEKWCCSLKLSHVPFIGGSSTGNNNVLDGIDMQAFVDGHIKDAVLDFHTNAGTGIGGRCILQYARCNLIGEDGHYRRESSYEHVFTDIGGGSIGTAYPNQVALVVSLTTDVSRGPAHRGRFYMPMPMWGVYDTGLISAADAASTAGRAKVFIEALSDVPGIDYPGSPGVVVMSRKAGAPKTRKCTGVEVGRVLDTQRRRRRSLVENYAVTDVDQGTF